MNITMNIECTPQEARILMGLPDVKPLQDELMAEMRDKMMSSVKGMAPTEMMKMWMPQVSGFEQMQDILEKMSGFGKSK